MTGTFVISSSMQDYLEAILNLSEKDGLARITDIAAMLSIAKASVSQTIGNLRDLGLVVQEKYGPVELTCAGRELAVKVRSRHHTLRKFLVEVLGVDPRTAEKDACLMEHVVSQHTMEKFLEFLETSGRANGDSETGISSGSVAVKMIPGEGEKILRSVNTRALSELKTGEKGKVLRTTAKGPGHRRILEMGVTPGTEICVKGMAPLGDPIEVLVRGYHLSLRKEEAATIFVEVL